jgi:hypothetical protein
MKRGVYLWIAAALLFAGCATAPTPIEKKDIAAPAVAEQEQTPTVPRLFEERDLLLEGVVLLDRPERPDPVKARSIFISLIKRYPQSRWRPAAEAFIRLIDERNALQEVNRQDRSLIEKTQTEKTTALQENDHLKKTVRELTEKLQSEMAAVTQENEQLKKDIQRLKTLETELQKRERMLR